jgi:hypothetical protein
VTRGRSLPVLQPTLRMWQILRQCYRGENPVTVLGRALDMLATADGHLHPNRSIKTGPGRPPARRHPLATKPGTPPRTTRSNTP